MRWLGLGVFVGLPLLAVAFASAWWAWRRLAFAFSLTAEAEIVGWKPIHYESDLGRPAFDRFCPIVSFRSADGRARVVALAYPEDSPVWPHPRPPTVHYVVKPWLIAAESKRAFLGPPVGVFGVGLAFLAFGLAAGTDRQDWIWLRDSIERGSGVSTAR